MISDWHLVVSQNKPEDRHPHNKNTGLGMPISRQLELLLSMNNFSYYRNYAGYPYFVDNR